MHDPELSVPLTRQEAAQALACINTVLKSSPFLTSGALQAAREKLQQAIQEAPR
jgi:hypothetical protein